ncbi:substrate import-associated zinc metallohydrolase lipoprotein [Algibacter pacificus]|uniref:substrate import-associated zinc metallohydrolase lipoprotein n=1 Tax=Algibacter pacificus TaxID=2599389 RepID=UPI0011CCAB5C|nr:substrate import-associated zinc metallohydrolase lipoprotein [Algibacter pacificus]
MKNIIKYFAIITLAMVNIQCNTSDDSNSKYVQPDTPDLSHPNDQYLYDNNGESLFEVYKTATRWRWNDNFIDPSQRATPVYSDLVVPSTKLVNHLWIEPYSTSGEGGEQLIADLFPAELVYIGSYIYNDDGSRLLGYAEAGARVTLLNLNSLDFSNRTWLANPGGGILATVHHEFSHIVHQTYGMPIGFSSISEKYLGQNWSNGVSRDDAIKLGMVRNYGTLNEFEDFCEIISHLVVVDEATFAEDFITQQDCSSLTDEDEIINCRELNEGRLKIKQKVDLVLDYYKTNFDIDLLKVRDIVQERLNNVVETGEIPD